MVASNIDGKRIGFPYWLKLRGKTLNPSVEGSCGNCKLHQGKF